MGIINVGKVGAKQIDFTGYSGENNYPSLGTGDAGTLIYDTSTSKLVLWTGSEWEEVKTKGTLGTSQFSNQKQKAKIESSQFSEK